MTMELYQIRHFVAIADTGSFTKAALRAAVSQPALSASIAKLEGELGVKLLHRTPKAITPTSAGRRFLATAQDVLSACGKIKADLQASTTERPLRIGVLRTLPTAHLAYLIETFQRASSDTTIELYDGSREELREQLLNRKLVACITSGENRRRGVNSAVLVREGYVLVVGLRHRFATVDSIAIEELQGEAFIVRSHCETFASTTKLLMDRGIRTHIVYKTDQDDRALALIAAGLGVALMPALYDSPGVRRIKVREFDVQRVIELQWNADTVDERLKSLIAFTTSYNWRSAPWIRPAVTKQTDRAVETTDRAFDRSKGAAAALRSASDRRRAIHE
jgi:DNA-binding transcriptional LysR family regulator